MGTGKMIENKKYYEGYEGEPEFIIRYGEYSLHIWDGYMTDIFGKPNIVEKGWSGFTRDYNEMINCYDDNNIEFSIDPKEYKEDAEQYQGKIFDYEETDEVLKNLISALEKAEKKGLEVIVQIL